MVLLLLASIVGCFGWLMMTKGKLATVQAEYDEAHKEAEAVRKLEKEAGDLETLAAPIGAKVEFIEAADTSGEPYWDAFDKVNRYIYARAQVLRFSIQPPNRVHFEVEIPDTTTCGRFVLNLIRCPDISNIRFGGGIPSGPGVGPNAGSGGGGMGMGMDMGMGMGPGMMGMPGEMGGMGGMPPMMGGGPMPSGGGGGTARAGGTIQLSVDAELREQITTPQPGGAGGAGAAPGGGMMPGGPGMMPGGPGMMPGGPGMMPGPGMVSGPGMMPGGPGMEGDSSMMPAPGDSSGGEDTESDED